MSSKLSLAMSDWDGRADGRDGPCWHNTVLQMGELVGVMPEDDDPSHL